MEQEKRKRGREEGEEGEDKKDLFVKNAAKKQDVSYTKTEEEQGESCIPSEKYLALGVFDFPWLHDHDQGIISKLSEDCWNFQDTFSSSLDDTCIQTEVECLYEIPTLNTSIKFPDNKFEENVDCVWSSLLNQPLQQGMPND